MTMSAKSAADLIVASAEAALPASARGAMPKNFCTLWPQAKPILELLSGVAILIPGLGAVAGGVLRGLIVVGDQIAKETCP